MSMWNGLHSHLTTHLASYSHEQSTLRNDSITSSSSPKLWSHYYPDTIDVTTIFWVVWNARLYKRGGSQADHYISTGRYSDTFSEVRFSFSCVIARKLEVSYR